MMMLMPLCDDDGDCMAVVENGPKAALSWLCNRIQATHRGTQTTI